MSDSEFYKAFSKNMKSMGLPVPSSIYGTVASTLATVGALAGAVAKLGASATVAEIFMTAPIAVGGTASAVAVSEIVAACGAVAASFYVGACIGSVLVAAYETLGIWDRLKITFFWLSDIADKLGTDVGDYLEGVYRNYAQASPLKASIVLAKRRG